MLVRDLAVAMRTHGVRYALVGGYAVALHGAVRGTIDLDVVLAPTEANYTSAEKALLGMGLSSRLPVRAEEVFQFRREYIDERNMIAWSFVDASDPTRLVDIVIAYEGKRLPIREVSVGGVVVPVLAKSALIKMKEASGRPQDLEDVRALRRLK